MLSSSWLSSTSLWFFSIAYRYLQNSVDAEDAAQESFVKAWRSLNKFDNTKSFQAWLLTITKNTSLDMLKKKKTIPFSAFENEAGENYLAARIASGEPLPAELAERSNFKSILDTARETLSPACRKVLSLYYDQGLKVDSMF